MVNPLNHIGNHGNFSSTEPHQINGGKNNEIISFNHKDNKKIDQLSPTNGSPQKDLPDLSDYYENFFDENDSLSSQSQTTNPLDPHIVNLIETYSPDCSRENLPKLTNRTRPNDLIGR